MADKNMRHGMPPEHSTPPPERTIPPEFNIPEEYAIPPEPGSGPEAAPLPDEIQGSGKTDARRERRRPAWRLAAAVMTLVLVFVATYGSSGSHVIRPNGRLTLRFYYGGAEYGSYKEGWVEVGEVDTRAGRFYGQITYWQYGEDGKDGKYININGDINPADKSIESSEGEVGMAQLYYDVSVANRKRFSVALPDGPRYYYPGNEYSDSFSMEFAGWMVSDGNGGYKKLSDPVTSEDVWDAMETYSNGESYVYIKAAFESEIVDKNDLTYEGSSGDEYPRYAVVLQANGGSFTEDGSDELYIAPQSLEFSGQADFFVEATCPTPVRDNMQFAGWYRDKDCKGERVTYLNIFGELKEDAYGAAPYAPMELYAKWE